MCRSKSRSLVVFNLVPVMALILVSVAATIVPAQAEQIVGSISGRVTYVYGPPDPAPVNVGDPVSIIFRYDTDEAVRGTGGQGSLFRFPSGRPNNGIDIEFSNFVVSSESLYSVIASNNLFQVQASDPAEMFFGIPDNEGSGLFESMLPEIPRSITDFKNLNVAETVNGEANLATNLSIAFELDLDSFTLAPEETTAKRVIFVNGIRTDPISAYKSGGLLFDRYIQPNTSEINSVLVFYNKSLGGWSDLVESIRQLKVLDFEQALRVAIFDNTDDDGQISPIEYNRIKTDLIVNQFSETNDMVAEATINGALPPELLNHVNIYLQLQDDPSSRALVFAYSQGNIFTNLAMEFLPRPLLNQVSIISIANPTNAVGRDSCGDHVTTYEDEVISLIRGYSPSLAFPPPCSPTVPNFGTSTQSWLQPDGHSLDFDYTDPVYPSHGIIDQKVIRELSSF